MTVKESIRKLAKSLGFQSMVVGSIEPMEKEREHYESWLDRGYAASMEYMKRDPGRRVTPALTYQGARSAIIVSVSYYTERSQDPGPFHGLVARYAVGLDYHAVIRAKLRELRDRLKQDLGIRVEGKPFTDDVALYEQGYAGRHGLGFAGKNTLIIGPRLSGSYNFVGELFTDIELDADGPYQGTCGKCFRCGDRCPTGAIVEPGNYVDSRLCISFLTIENRGEIPLALRSKLGRWVFGCDVCQEVCPYNQRPPLAPWPEFHPDRGTGHFLDLLDLLKVPDEKEFRRLFGHTALRRPKRRGLTRNALVVIGNQVRSTFADKGSSGGCTVEPDAVLTALQGFTDSEPDPMLREHAAWAISQFQDILDYRPALRRIMQRETDGETRARLREYENAI